MDIGIMIASSVVSLSVWVFSTPIPHTLSVTILLKQYSDHIWTISRKRGHTSFHLTLTFYKGDFSE